MYVRVTGIIEGAAGMGRNYVDPFTILPAPDGASPFSVAEGAQAVSKFLHINNMVSRYKIDPSLFGIYPKPFDLE